MVVCFTQKMRLVCATWNKKKTDEKNKEDVLKKEEGEKDEEDQEQSSV